MYLLYVYFLKIILKTVSIYIALIQSNIQLSRILGELAKPNSIVLFNFLDYLFLFYIIYFHEFVITGTVS